MTSTSSTPHLPLNKKGGQSSRYPSPVVEASYSHRTLYAQTRSSKPPTSGPVHQSQLNYTHPSASSTSVFSQHTHTRSMPSDISKVFGNFKRSLSLSRIKNEPVPQASQYTGTTPEEDAARIYKLSPQRPLKPPPTFHQIASGLAVASKVKQPALRRPSLPPAPARSSLKRITSNSSGIPSSTNSPSLSIGSSPSFSTSTRSLQSSASNMPVFTYASSASSVTNSTAESSVPPSAGVSGANRRRHKLSLSISTLTGSKRTVPTDRGVAAQSHGLSGRSTPDSLASYTNGKGSSIGHDSKKAVRFTESDEDVLQKIPSSVTPTVVPASSSKSGSMGKLLTEKKGRLFNLS